MAIRESKLWFWHMMSGVALVLFLGIHTAIQHFGSVLRFLGLGNGEALAWGSVASRMPQLSHTIIYLGLLIFGLFHGLYGLRSMICELKMPEGLKRTASVLILLVGIGLVAYGAWSILYGFVNAGQITATKMN